MKQWKRADLYARAHMIDQWTASFLPLGEGALLKWRHAHKVYEWPFFDPGEGADWGLYTSLRRHDIWLLENSLNIYRVHVQGLTYMYTWCRL